MNGLECTLRYVVNNNLIFDYFVEKYCNVQVCSFSLRKTETRDVWYVIRNTLLRTNTKLVIQDGRSVHLK